MGKKHPEVDTYTKNGRVLVDVADLIAACVVNGDRSVAAWLADNLLADKRSSDGT